MDNKKSEENKKSINNNKSSAQKIIIISNEFSNLYDKKSYISKYLKGIISREDWNKIILDANKIVGFSWTKKKDLEIIELPKFLSVLALISIILTFIYMITLYLAGTSEGDQTILITASIIAITVSCILAVVLYTFNFRRKMKKFLSMEEIMKTEMENFITGVNYKYKGKLEFCYNPSDTKIICKIIDKRNMRRLSVSEEDKELINNEEREEQENGARQSEVSNSKERGEYK